MSGDSGQETWTEVSGLALADAVNGSELVLVSWSHARQLPQRGVVEDDIRWNTAFTRDVQTHTTEDLEERVVDAIPPRLRTPSARHACFLSARNSLASERQRGLAVRIFQK